MKRTACPHHTVLPAFCCHAKNGNVIQPGRPFALHRRFFLEDKRSAVRAWWLGHAQRHGLPMCVPVCENHPKFFLTLGAVVLNRPAAGVVFGDEPGRAQKMAQILVK